MTRRRNRVVQSSDVRVLRAFPEECRTTRLCARRPAHAAGADALSDAWPRLARRDQAAVAISRASRRSLRASAIIALPCAIA